MSKEYAAAIAAHNAAFAKFNEVRDAFRARKVDADVFLSAKKDYEAATAIFDEAFAKEAAK